MAGFMRKLLFEVGGSGMLHSYQVGLRTMCTKVIQVDRSGGKNIYHVHTPQNELYKKNYPKALMYGGPTKHQISVCKILGILGVFTLLS